MMMSYFDKCEDHYFTAICNLRLAEVTQPTTECSVAPFVKH